MTVDPQAAAETLARFEAHRQAWSRNELIRTLYGRWYGQVRAALPDRALGPWIELGSGPGLARDFIPELELSDVVKAPWHQHRVSAEALPWPDASVGALVLFDVLHHIPAPAAFLTEAVRVLRPGGRVVLCEPYVSPLSFPVYRFFHEERLDFAVDPLGPSPVRSVRPFDGNQAIPTALFVRQAAELQRRFPDLFLRELRFLAGPSYPSSGGFSRAPLLPGRLWRALLAIEERLPPALFRYIGFRLLAVLERRL